MSVDYSAKIVVAVPYKDIYEKYYEDIYLEVDFPDFYEWAENNDLRQFSPFCDAPPSESLYGRVLDETDDYGFTFIDLDQLNPLSKEICGSLRYKFTGLNWKTYLTTIGD